MAAIPAGLVWGDLGPFGPRSRPFHAEHGGIRFPGRRGGQQLDRAGGVHPEPPARRKVRVRCGSARRPATFSADFAYLSYHGSRSFAPAYGNQPPGPGAGFRSSPASGSDWWLPPSRCCSWCRRFTPILDDFGLTRSAGAGTPGTMRPRPRNQHNRRGGRSWPNSAPYGHQCAVCGSGCVPGSCRSPAGSRGTGTLPPVASSRPGPIPGAPGKSDHGQTQTTASGTALKRHLDFDIGDISLQSTGHLVEPHALEDDGASAPKSVGQRTRRCRFVADHQSGTAGPPGPEPCRPMVFSKLPPLQKPGVDGRALMI